MRYAFVREYIDFVHLYVQRKLTFVQKLLQAPSDVIRSLLVPTCIQCHVKMLSCVRNLTCILVIFVVIMLKKNSKCSVK